MKNLLYILLFLLSVPVFAEDQTSATSEFAQANELYRNEKYADAADMYELIIKRYKQHSSELYFNLGNAYYKLNKVGPAIYNYEKALLLEPKSNLIKNNLNFAHKMMIDEVKEVPTTGFPALIHKFTGAFSYDTWAWLAVLFSFLFLASFAGYYFLVNALHKRLFFFAMLLMLFMIIVSIFSGFFEKERITSERPAIVFAPIASVKGEPKTNASEAASIHEGTKVYVTEELGEWKRVVLPDGNDGWIESSTIKELK